jgi:predicted transposase YbfD/YdcC
MSFITMFREVHDPRDMNARHDLGELLFLALSATLCGAKTCVEIADFAAERQEEFKDILTLKHGVPSHDTFSRVFRLLDPTQLGRVLTLFTAAFRAALGVPAPKGSVAVDGKSLRRGYDKGRAFMPPLMVSVWDVETRLAIAAMRAPDGDEVNAALAILKTVALKGSIVTADALHCHPAMAKAALAAKADYALVLKANQAILFKAAEAGFAAAARLAVFETIEQQTHGRREIRRAAVLPVRRLKPKPSFPGLKAIGRIEAERTGTNGKVTQAVRYIALSRVYSPKRLAEIVREYWLIENQLHWPLDVVFREDDARTRKDNGPQNLAVIRRLAQNILRAHPLNISMARKMRKADWNKEFFFELFAYMR